LTYPSEKDITVGAVVLPQFCLFHVQSFILMKKSLLSLLCLFLLPEAIAIPTNQRGWDANANISAKHPEWTLVFEDEFNSLNMNNWSRIPYQESTNADWRKFQSTDESLVEITTSGSDSIVRLWGRYGDYTSQSDQEGTNDTYACGGLYTLGKFSFQYGYVEVQARFDCTKGCWPAIWMMPSSGAGWPVNGEIDIMEHLNSEAKAYHTIHYGSGDKSKQGTTKAMNSKWVDNWHTWGMEWTANSISFYCDGTLTKTFTPQANDGWPFGKEGNEFYLIIDQQIGGSWVGSVDQETLKNTGSSMDINYVRVYSTPEYMHLIPEPAAACLALLGLLPFATRRRRN